MSGRRRGADVAWSGVPDLTRPISNVAQVRIDCIIDIVCTVNIIILYRLQGAMSKARSCNYSEKSISPFLQ